MSENGDENVKPSPADTMDALERRLARLENDLETWVADSYVESSGPSDATMVSAVILLAAVAAALAGYYMLRVNRAAG